MRLTIWNGLTLKETDLVAVCTSSPISGSSPTTSSKPLHLENE